MSTQPNSTSTEVGFDMNMTLHTIQHETQIYQKEYIAEVFCLRPYLTILTTTKYNLTQLCSGGGASIFPLGLTLSQLQEQLKGQHQG